MIVVDSNVLAARNLTSAQTRVAEQVEKLDPLWIVPPLWRYEFQNILVKTLWTRQLTPEAAVMVWRKTSTQMLENEHEPSPEKVIELSGRHRITGYDATFMALAMELDVICVTEDEELQRKFSGIAVSMQTFIHRASNDRLVQEAPSVDRTGPASSRKAAAYRKRKK